MAAIFMLLGLATYLHGYRYLPARVERRTFEGTRLIDTERHSVYALGAVIISIFQSTAFYQVFNVNAIWIQQHIAPDVGGFPIPWYQSINSVFSILGVPLLFRISRQQPLGDASRTSSQGPVGSLGISFFYYWPTLLALVSRAAPAVNATLMGLTFMRVFISNTMIGCIGGF